MLTFDCLVLSKNSQAVSAREGRTDVLLISLPVPVETQNRCFSRSRLLVFLGLAISVFTWGLEYKLSLYEPPAAIAHQVPKAKLLSHDERLRTVDTIRAIVTRPVMRITPQISFLAALLFPGPTIADVRFVTRASDSIPAPPSSLTSELFVRPPPCLS